MKTEKRINKIAELLQKYEEENKILKEKGRFNMQQANNTMKRFAEEMGSYFLKEIKEINSQLPKGEKSHKDVQGKREDASNNQNEDGEIRKVVDSSSHLPQSSPADIK